MESQQSRRIVTALAHQVETAADARQIANAIVSTWVEIDAALAPVLGRRAVALLYQRSICLAARTHPWLAGMCDEAQALAPQALRAAFAEQDRAAAAAGGYELLQAFHETLASLVGPPLAERLLRFVCASEGPGAQASPRLTVVEPSRRGLTS